MMHYTVTAQQMRQMERAAFRQGVPPLLVMENAARQVCDHLIALLGGAKGKRVLFLCGPGNNGGDGLAAARLFLQAGGYAAIYLAGKPASPHAQGNLHYARYLGIPVVEVLPSPVHFDGLVDALLGIGLDRAPEGDMLDAIQWANTSRLPILAVDIPSGMEADEGKVPGECIQATETVTFHTAKMGLFLSPQRHCCGRITVADIGLQPADHGVPYYTESDLPALLPPRPVTAHKGDFGRVLVLGGSAGKAGAAAMCALGALRAGAGLVTIACPGEIISVLQTLAPNAMCVPLDEAEKVPFDVLAAGCGLGQSDEARQALTTLLQKAPAAVLDADALNLLAASPVPLPAKTVLTPHPLEAARLLHCPLQEVLDDLVGSALLLLDEYPGCTAVLKSSVSVIAVKNHLALNVAGSPALAKGGSGDALCGILAATLCEKGDPFESSRLACLRLGVAGERAAAALSERAVLTGDVLHFLP